MNATKGWTSPCLRPWNPPVRCRCFWRNVDFCSDQKNWRWGMCLPQKIKSSNPEKLMGLEDDPFLLKMTPIFKATFWFLGMSSVELLSFASVWSGHFLGRIQSFWDKFIVDVSPNSKVVNHQTWLVSLLNVSIFRISISSRCSPIASLKTDDALWDASTSLCRWWIFHPKKIIKSLESLCFHSSQIPTTRKFLGGNTSSLDQELAQIAEYYREAGFLGKSW